MPAILQALARRYTKSAVAVRAAAARRIVNRLVTGAFRQTVASAMAWASALFVPQFNDPADAGFIPRRG